MTRAIALAAAAMSLYPFSLQSQSWNSLAVGVGFDGRLTYTADTEGNRIPDFSHAGYRNSTVPLPDIPVMRTVQPVEGDNTSHLQTIINEVGTLPLNGDGFRGAILLGPGVYRLSGTIALNVSGLVLRGSGDGPDSSQHTILHATGDSLTQTAVIIAGGGTDTRWSQQESGTVSSITSDTVFVGSRTFDVSNGSLYAVGDNIIVTHPCTEAWLQAVDYGGTAADAGWTANSQPILYNRRVVSVEGNRLTIDAPVFATLVRSLSQATVYRYTRSGLRTQIGIEHLRIDIAAPGVTTDPNGNERDHAWHGIWLKQIEDAWVRRVTVLHFGQSGIITSTASRVTIDSVAALDPVSTITGERRYNFNTYTASQLVLFRSCWARHGRHDFVSNGSSWVSGCVFVDCLSDSTYAPSEGHRRWSQGLLYDNLTFTHPIEDGYVLGLYNRGDFGTGHGWASVHSVAWNCSAPGRAFVVQKPPTAQNYAIGCWVDTVASSRPLAPFTHPRGYVEGTRQAGLEPRSLFYAQLADRLGASTGVHDLAGAEFPEQWVMMDVYPNPMNPETKIQYTLHHPGIVTLTVFDLLGRVVAELVDGERPVGTHVVRWSPDRSASGMYLLRLHARSGDQPTRGAVAVRKIVLAR